MKNKSAFTLVEILVVVLIIGILTAVAIPMYQSAVDKTHWSTLLPTARALKNAEEAYLMATNVYTDNADALDVAATQGDATYQLQMPDSAARYVIRATSDKLPNVRLAQYLDENAAFASQLHCEAKTGDERANKLCEKLLQGSKLNETNDGYTRYMLDGTVDKPTCNAMNRAWSTNKGSCYKTKQERCAANKDTTWNATIGTCTYTGKYTQDNITLEEGEICKAWGNTCNGLVVNAGGECQAHPAASHTCSDSDFLDGSICLGTGASCSNSNFSNGSVCKSGSNSGNCLASTFDNSLCISHNFYGGCKQSTFNNDSVCYAGTDVYKDYGCAQATYNDTSCCCGGDSCKAAHRCSEERCTQVEQQVQEIEQQVKQIHY